MGVFFYFVCETNIRELRWFTMVFVNRYAFQDFYVKQYFDSFLVYS